MKSDGWEQKLRNDILQIDSNQSLQQNRLQMKRNIWNPRSYWKPEIFALTGQALILIFNSTWKFFEQSATEIIIYSVAVLAFITQ